MKHSGISFHGTPSPLEVCALGKSMQQSHTRTANYNVATPFQLVLGNFLWFITPTALGGYNCVSKITNQYTKYRAV